MRPVEPPCRRARPRPRPRHRSPATDGDARIRARRDRPVPAPEGAPGRSRSDRAVLLALAPSEQSRPHPRHGLLERSDAALRAAQLQLAVADEADDHREQQEGPIAISAAAQSGSQMAMTAMTRTTNATRNRKTKTSAT